MPFYTYSLAAHTVALCLEKGWYVAAVCVNGHGKAWKHAELKTAFPPQVTLQAIGDRLKCSACGSRDGRIDVWQDDSAPRKPRGTVGLEPPQ